jgi:ribosomal RNA-processing protein 9
VDEDDETETEGDAWRDVRRGHKLSVTGMSLTPDDSTCYTVSKDGSIARWDIETGARTRFPRGPPAVVDPTRGGGGPMAPPKCGAATLLCCAVSQEHNMLCVAGTDKRIHVWDTRTMKKVHEFASHRGAVTGLAIRDGTGQMFSSSTDKTLKVWSLDDMAYVDTLFGHQSDVLGVAPQRKERVVTVGRDRTCRFWKVAEDSQLIFRPSPGGGQLESVAFTSADTWITGADDGTVALWSTTKKRSVMEWKNVHGFGEEMTGPKFATEDEVDAAVESRLDAQAACGMPETPDPPSSVGLCGRWVNAVAVSKGGDLCASGAGDGAIRVWKISDEPGRQLMPLFTLPARGFVNSLAVASSGRFVLAGMGQEPRQGRWGRDAQARNGLLMHRLTLED